MGISVRQKDGNWYVFIRYRGERAAHKCVDQQHAEDTQRAVSTAITAGQFDIAAFRRPEPAAEKESSSPTLKQFVDDTMYPLWEASLSAGSVTRYETSFRLHILSALGDFRLEELTRDRIKKFVVSLLRKSAEKRTRDEERQKEEAERRLSKDSIRLIVAALRVALTEAVEKNIISSNPATRLGKLYKEAGQDHEEVDPFSADEVPILLEATKAHFGTDNYVVMLAAFHTGMRAGELAGLQWPDIDFRNRFITVRRQYKDGDHKKTKTKKMRKIDISDVLLEELKTLKKRRQREYLGRGQNEIPVTVFLSPGRIIWEEGEQVGRAEGQPLDMDNWRNRIFWKACDKANVRRRRLHDTRHSFASILLMNGESPAYVKDQLGHSSIKMTVDIYGHWIPGANRQAVNKLPSLSTIQSAGKAAAD
jgi:integrase